MSPNHVTENQIDHIFINQRFRRSCKDVRVMRGADVASDHLVVTQIRLPLKKLKNQRRDQNKYNVGLLRERSKQESFRLSLANRYAPPQELTEDDLTDIETHWKHSKELWIRTCKEVLGKKRVNHKEWISEDTISQAEVDLPISVEKPSTEEIKKEIRTLKNGKAADPDGIPADALKADIDTAPDVLHNLGINLG